MSALTFVSRSLPPQRVDVSVLVPANLREKSRAQIRALPLYVGNRQVALGELFDVKGGDIERIVFEGGGDRLDRIGGELDTGSIVVRGPVGAYLGIGMRGGRIEVHGSCGAYAASGLRDGVVAISGDAGDFLGAPLPGDMQGMRGGTVVVSGNSGARTGDRMRRGLILVRGNVGDYCGSRMIAGTIAALGECGEWPGFCMKRGTLLLPRGRADWPATFNDCGTHALPMLPLLVRSCRRLDPAFEALGELDGRVRRLMGDLACGGMGEILSAAS